MFKRDKVPTLEETLTVIQGYVKGQLQTRNKAIEEFEQQRKKVASDIQKIIQEMNEKEKLQLNKATALENELKELAFQQEEVADELVCVENENEAAIIEAKLTDISTKRGVLEAKIKAFSNKRIGLSRASDRKMLAKKVQEYDAIKFKGIGFFEQKELFRSLVKALEQEVAPTLSSSYDGLSNATAPKVTGVQVAFNYSLFDALVEPETTELFSMFSERGLNRERAEQKKQEAVTKWLLNDFNIKLDDFLKQYIADEKERRDEFARQEDERKARERREREERNTRILNKQGYAYETRGNL